MKISKAIIPIAGWGTRRLPITKVVEKSMLPVGNRPIVDYVVEDCIAAGIKDIYFVISEVEPSQVQAYYEPNAKLERYLIERAKVDRLELIRNAPDDVNFHYVVQPDDGRYGTAVPVALATEVFAINEPVAVLMGDDFIYKAKGGSEVANMMAEMQNETDSVILGAPVAEKDISLYGVFKVSRGGMLEEIVEKPEPAQAPSDLINISKYILSAKLLKMVCDHVKNNQIGPDAEYLITDPITEYAQGNCMRVMRVTGEYLDGGTLDGWLHANNVVCGQNLP
jgi:UTP--glucose-1-phosphate uridylyltransferase